MATHPWTISDAFIDIPADTWQGKESEFLKDLKIHLPFSPWMHGLVDTLEEWIKTKSLSCQTSGSTGAPKQFSFNRSQIQRSAFRTLSYLNIGADSWLYCPIPLAYIGGKMMLFRALFGGHHLRIVQPSLHPNHFKEKAFALASFTPSMWNEVLDSFPHNNCVILLGGGPVSHSLELASKRFTSVYNSYGMTETLSHVALKKLNQDTHFTPLEGVQLSTGPMGNLLIADGDIRLNTNDLVRFNGIGQFSIDGRQDFVINSGGVKINPEAWEKELGIPCCISWVSSEKFGQELVLVVNENQVPNWKEILSLAKGKGLLKKIFLSPELPKTPNGKTDRLALQQMVEGQQQAILTLEK